MLLPSITTVSLTSSFAQTFISHVTFPIMIQVSFWFKHLVLTCGMWTKCKMCLSIYKMLKSILLLSNRFPEDLNCFIRKITFHKTVCFSFCPFIKQILTECSLRLPCTETSWRAGTTCLYPQHPAQSSAKDDVLNTRAAKMSKTQV